VSGGLQQLLAQSGCREHSEPVLSSGGRHLSSPHTQPLTPAYSSPHTQRPAQAQQLWQAGQLFPSLHLAPLLLRLRAARQTLAPHAPLRVKPSPHTQLAPHRSTPQLLGSAGLLWAGLGGSAPRALCLAAAASRAAHSPGKAAASEQRAGAAAARPARRLRSCGRCEGLGRSRLRSGRQAWLDQGSAHRAPVGHSAAQGGARRSWVEEHPPLRSALVPPVPPCAAAAPDPSPEDRRAQEDREPSAAGREPKAYAPRLRAAGAPLAL
jgi:hypothetical protein